MQKPPSKGSGTRRGGGKTLDVRKKKYSDNLMSLHVNAVAENVKDSWFIKGSASTGLSASEFYLTFYQSNSTTDLNKVSEDDVAAEQVALAESISRKLGMAAGAALEVARNELRKKKDVVKKFQQACFVRAAELDLSKNEGTLRDAEAALIIVQETVDSIIRDLQAAEDSEASLSEHLACTAKAYLQFGRLLTNQLTVEFDVNIALPKAQASISKARAENSLCAGAWKRLDRDSGAFDARVLAVRQGVVDLEQQLIMASPTDFVAEINELLAVAQEIQDEVSGSILVRMWDVWRMALIEREAVMGVEAIGQTAQDLAAFAASGGNAVMKFAGPLASRSPILPTVTTSAPPAMTSAPATVTAPSNTLPEDPATFKTRQTTAKAAKKSEAFSISDLRSKDAAQQASPAVTSHNDGDIPAASPPFSTVDLILQLCAMKIDGVMADAAATESKTAAIQAVVSKSSTNGLERVGPSTSANSSIATGALGSVEPSASPASLKGASSFSDARAVRIFMDMRLDLEERAANIQKTAENMANAEQQVKFILRACQTQLAQVRDAATAAKQDLQRAAVGSDSEKRKQQIEADLLKIDEVLGKGDSSVSRKSQKIIDSFLQLKKLQLSDAGSTKDIRNMTKELNQFERCVLSRAAQCSDTRR